MVDNTSQLQLEELQRLSEITQKINSGLVLEEVLEYAYDSFREILPYDRIGFGFLEKEGRELCCRWVKSESSVVRIGVGYSAKVAGSSLEPLLHSNEPRIINDLEQYLALHPESTSTQDILKEGMRSSLTFPLWARAKPLGMIFFSSVNRNVYSAEHVEGFRRIADRMAIIVEKGWLYQQLLELNKLKNEFLGMAAHDLRSPLVVIQGYLELLLEGQIGRLDANQYSCLEVMQRSCERMVGLINDLLDVSAIEADAFKLEKSNFDLVGLLEESLVLHQMEANAKLIEISLSAPEPLLVDADRGRIGQVMNNLISNAIKFSMPKTAVQIVACREGEEIIVKVVDNGLGIPEKEMPKLFTSFGRTTVRPTGNESSTGLGLAIVKKFVSAHGGRIWAESEVKKGSTFTFTLPSAAQPESVLQ